MFYDSQIALKSYEQLVNSYYLRSLLGSGSPGRGIPFVIACKKKSEKQGNLPAGGRFNGCGI